MGSLANGRAMSVPSFWSGFRRTPGSATTLNDLLHLPGQTIAFLGSDQSSAHRELDQLSGILDPELDHPSGSPDDIDQRIGHRAPEHTGNARDRLQQRR